MQKALFRRAFLIFAPQGLTAVVVSVMHAHYERAFRAKAGAKREINGGLRRRVGVDIQRPASCEITCRKTVKVALRTGHSSRSVLIKLDRILHCSELKGRRTGQSRLCNDVGFELEMS